MKLCLIVILMIQSGYCLTNRVIFPCVASQHQEKKTHQPTAWNATPPKLACEGEIFSSYTKRPGPIISPGVPCEVNWIDDDQKDFSDKVKVSAKGIELNNKFYYLSVTKKSTNLTLQTRKGESVLFQTCPKEDEVQRAQPGLDHDLTDSTHNFRVLAIGGISFVCILVLLFMMLLYSKCWYSDLLHKENRTADVIEMHQLSSHGRINI